MSTASPGTTCQALMNRPVGTKSSRTTPRRRIQAQKKPRMGLLLKEMVRDTGFEPVTPTVSR